MAKITQTIQKIKKEVARLLILGLAVTTIAPANVYATDDVGENAFYVDEYTPTATNWDMYDEDYLDLFIGWHRDKAPLEYTITYDLQGGALADGEENPTSYVEDTEDDIVLYNPSKIGYDFLGWVGTDDHNAIITPRMTTMTIPAGSTGDRYYRAIFKPTVYRITYDYNGGHVFANNKSSYTVEDEPFELNNPVKEGQIFKGYVYSVSGNAFTTTPVKIEGSNKIQPGTGADDWRGDIAFKAVYEDRKTGFIKELPTASPITLGSVLGLSTLTGGKVTVSSTDDTEIPGTWRWIDPLILPTLDDSESTLYDVMFIPDAIDEYAPIQGQITIKVNEVPDERISPYIKGKPTGSDAYEGDPLGSSLLSGGSVTVSETDETSVPGKWVWDNASIILKLSDSETTEFLTWFIPNDTFRYKPVYTTIKIKVTERPDERITPYIAEDPDGSDAYEKDPLGSSILSGGKVTVSDTDNTPVAGKWMWDDASVLLALTDSETTEFTTWFIPEDTFHYKPVSTKIKIKVTERPDERISPYIAEDPTGSDAYATEPLGSSVLSGGKVTISSTDDTVVSGKWVWDNAAYELALADSETTDFTTWFIPDDTFHYKPISTDINIKVTERFVFPYIAEDPTGSDAFATEPLGSSILSGGKVTVSAMDDTIVPGKWVWDDAAYELALTDSETTGFTTWFIPTDTTRYKAVSTAIKIKITERHMLPYIAEDPTGSDAYALDPLGSSVLSGGKVTVSSTDNTVVAGKWMWDDAAIELALTDSETTDFMAWFVPTDTTRYRPVSTTVRIKVTDRHKVPYIEQKPTGSDAYEKDPLGSSILTGGRVTVSATDDTVVPGKWMWDDASHELALADSETTDFIVWFVPTDTTQFRATSTTIQIKVTKRPDERITPYIAEDPEGSDAYAEDPLGSSILSGGEVTVSSTDNTEVTGKWYWDNAAYELALSDSETTEFTTWFIPDNTFLYKPVSTAIKIKVTERPDNRITPYIKEKPAGSDSYEEDHLGNSVFSGGQVTVSSTDNTAVTGKWMWDEAAYILALTDSQTTDFEAWFIPTDTFTYKPVSTTIKIKVSERPDERITPYIKGKPVGSDAYDKDPLGSSILSGGQVTVSSTDATIVPGKWMWDDASIRLTLADSETTDFTTWFIPNDTFTYKPVSTTIKIKVTERPDERIAPYIKGKPVGSDAYENDVLGSSILSGGQVTVSSTDGTVVLGKWFWDEAATVLALTDSETTDFTTWFVPNDTFHYQPVSTTIKIKVVEKPDERITPYVKEKPSGSDAYEKDVLGSSVFSGGEVTVSSTDDTMVTGKWFWDEASYELALTDSETTSFTAWFMPNDTFTYKPVTTTIKIKVTERPDERITPYIKGKPVGSDAYATEPLGSSILSGGEVTVSSTDNTEVTGKWMWDDASILLALTDSETTDFTTWFIPDDTFTYKPVSTTIKIKVTERPDERITPYVKEKPSGSDAYEKDILGSSVFTGGEVTISSTDDTVLPGKWFWDEASIILALTDSETTDFTAWFMPNDTFRYKPVSTTIRIKVTEEPDDRITPYIKGKPVGSDTYVEDPLGSSILSGGAVTVSETDDTAVTGKWMWDNASIILALADSETTDFTTWFIPNDTFHYKPVSTTIKIKVKEKITPYVKEKPAGSDSYVEDHLGNSIFTGGTVTISETDDTVVPGKWMWDNAAYELALTDSETTEFIAWFIPNDTDHYKVTSTTIKIKVGERPDERIVPYVKVKPTGSDSYSEDYLGSSIITGGTVTVSETDDTVVSGKWMWDEASIVLALTDSETTEFTTWFIPDDTFNYKATSTKIKIKVTERPDNRITPYIKGKPVGSDAFALDPLGSSILSGGQVTVSNTDDTVVTGKWMWDNAAIILALTDSETTNFTTWFIPDDTFTYKPVSTTIKIKVTERPDPTAKEPYVKTKPTVLTEYVDGENLGTKEVTGGTVTVSETNNTVVPGKWIWDRAHTVVHEDDSETTEYTVIFIPEDNITYRTTTTTITVKVKEAPDKITPFIKGAPEGTDSYAGDYLGSSVFIGGQVTVAENDDTIVPGRWVWDNAAYILKLSDSEITEFKAWFMPTDSDTYKSVSTDLKIKITERPDNKPVEPYVKVKPEVKVEYRDTEYLGKNEITGGTVTVSETDNTVVSGNWVWEKSHTVVHEGDSNVTEYKVIFVPEEKEKYTTTSTTIKVIVKEALQKIVPYIKGKPNGSDAYALDYLGSSILTGGEVTVSETDDTAVTGLWVWADASQVLQLTDSEATEFTAWFIPDDTDTYHIVSTGVKIKVTERPEKEIIIPYIKEKPEIRTDYHEGEYIGEKVIEGGEVTVSVSDNTAVPGRWVWEKSYLVVKESDSEVTEYTVLFVPDDRETYTTTQTTITVIVKEANKKKTPVLSDGLPVGSAIYEEDLLERSYLSGGRMQVSETDTTPVEGYWYWRYPKTQVALTDNMTTLFAVMFVPLDLDEYNIVHTAITIPVLPKKVRKVPYIDGNVSGSPAYEKTPLGGSILTGGIAYKDDTKQERVEGTWYWVNPAIILKMEDSKYITEKITETLQVKKNNPDATHFEAVFIPEDTDTWKNVFQTTTIEVLPLNEEFKQKKGYIDELPTGSAITEGNYLAASLLSGGRVTESAESAKEVPGRWIWKHPDLLPLLSDSKVTPFDVIFIPDSFEFERLEGAITIEVLPFKPTLIDNSKTIHKPEASAIYLGQSLADSELTGGEVLDKDGKVIKGTWSWTDSTIRPLLSDSNRTLYEVIFTPDDDKIEPARTKITVTVKEFEKYDIGDVYITMGWRPGSKHSGPYKYNRKYTGDPITPSVYCTHAQQSYNDKGFRDGRMKTRLLRENVDYTVEYKNNVNVGEATVVVHGIGDYEGTVTKAFTISQKTLKYFTLDQMPNFVYTGEDLTSLISENVIVRDKGRKVDPKDYIIQIAGDTVGSPDKDTVLSVAVKANTYGNYKNAISKNYKFMILSKEGVSIKDCKVRLKKDPGKPRIYKVKGFKPQIIVTGPDGKRLTKKNYSINYTDNVNAGTCTIELKGRGKYYGTVSACQFEILPAKLKDATVKSISTLYYRGSLEDLVPRVKYKGVVLKKNKDFVFNTVSVDEIGFGPAKAVRVTGTISSCCANFTGTKNVRLVIGKRNIGDKIKTRVIPGMRINDSAELTGDAVELNVGLKDKELLHSMIPDKGSVVAYYNGELLKEGIDYELTIRENNKGTTKYILKGLSLYKGKRSVKVKTSGR